MTETPTLAFLHPGGLRLTRAWDAIDLGALGDYGVRVHWTDAPFRWHRDPGPELFVVLRGSIDMHHRDGVGEHVTRMQVGDICRIDAGVWHVAAPIGEALVLVLERRGNPEEVVPCVES